MAAREDNIKALEERMAGKRYGKLTFKKYAYDENGYRYCYFDCDCGTKNIAINYQSVLRGSTRSCGCMKSDIIKSMMLEKRMKILEKYKGKRFGYLTVVDIVSKPTNNHNILCRCDCGKLYEAASYNLANGSLKSCGCRGRFSQSLESPVRE